MATQQSKLWNPRKAQWLTLEPHAYAALVLFAESKARATTVLVSYTQLHRHIAEEIIEHNWHLIKKG